ncbi:MAG: hypothetical protein UDG28_01940 [Prevotellamassilia sp.]|jgi:hypothetical protein|nr:hypothetical protein [Prevotellamassilia sp.]
MKSYITELYACPARLLDEVMITPDGMAAFVPDYVRWTRIGLSGIARMEVTDSAENGVRRFTTTLQAVVDERPAPVREPQAFLAVGAEGRAYLVGSGVRPMPLVTVQDIHPDRTSERAACTLTITLLAAHGALLAKSFKNIKPLITDENK